MIHSLSIQNFLSFKEEICFSFEAANEKEHEDYQIVEVAPNVILLKLGVIYGANASGKSNLIEAFKYLKAFWFTITESKDEKTDVIPFLLDLQTPNEPTIFKLIFYIEERKYTYTLEINERFVVNEKLEFYPGTQPAIIFERRINNNISEINFGKKIKISQIAKDEINIKCLPNMSVFAAYNQVNLNISELEKVLSWMRKQFMNIIDHDTILLEYAEKTISDNQHIKKDILTFLHKADFNITDAQMQYVKKEVPEFIIDNLAKSENIPLSEIERIKKEKTITVKEISFFHKIINAKGEEKNFALSKDLQSKGTLRTFGLATAILQAQIRNAFLCIDEIESNLHPHLIEFILKKFLHESKQSQLLIATHYDGLLEKDELLRKDNIWFTEKKDNGSTKLYPLSAFKAVNRLSSIQKAYKYGKFGAIPNI